MTMKQSRLNKKKQNEEKLENKGGGREKNLLYKAKLITCPEKCLLLKLNLQLIKYTRNLKLFQIQCNLLKSDFVQNVRTLIKSKHLIISIKLGWHDIFIAFTHLNIRKN